MSKSNKVNVMTGTAASSISAALVAQGSPPMVAVTPRSMGKTTAISLFLTNGEAFQLDSGELIDPDRLTMSADGVSYMVATPEEMERRLEQVMTPSTDFDGLPNRLSIDRSSKYHTSCGAYVGVKIDGVEAPNCIEFCVSEGWVRLGQVTHSFVSQAETKSAPKQYGKVEVWWKATPSRQVRRQMARLAR